MKIYFFLFLVINVIARQKDIYECDTIKSNQNQTSAQNFNYCKRPNIILHLLNKLIFYYNKIICFIKIKKLQFKEFFKNLQKSRRSWKEKLQEIDPDAFVITNKDKEIRKANADFFEQLKKFNESMGFTNELSNNIITEGLL